MKNRITSFFAVLSIVVLIFSGCQTNQSVGTAGSECWVAWPQLNYGIMECEKLMVQDWYSGRCEATSRNRMAETEAGYYLAYNDYLYYADKNNLDTWLPVCSKPNCDHEAAHDRCDAYIRSNFIIRDNRIFFSADAMQYPELCSTDVPVEAVFSKELDGSDIRLEYLNKDMSCDAGGIMGCYLTSEHWLCFVVNLNTDGSHHFQLFRVTDQGTEVLVDEVTEDRTGKTLFNERNYYLIEGEPSFSHYYLGPIPYAECRYVNGEPYFTDLSAYYEDGRYFAGNTLRLYRKNDGYYDVDLEAGAEVHVADAVLESSESIVMLPNCIVESSLFYTTHNMLPKEQNHTMQLFDGEKWRDVELPQELLKSGYQKFLVLKGVASDSIFFTYQSLSEVHMYRIPIGNGELTLEYCGRIK